MAEPVTDVARQKPKRKRFRLRPWLRALHRDAGYLIVGLTFVYALSGLAVNHIKDWDPNFHQISVTHKLDSPLPKNDQDAAQKILAQLGQSAKEPEVYALDERHFEIVLDQRTLHVDREARTVLEEGQRPRFFLRLANWLHLNRGKPAWTYIADGYAVLLLFLATSGLFMIAGRKGLVGRGGVITALGAIIPIAYVSLTGGP